MPAGRATWNWWLLVLLLLVLAVVTACAAEDARESGLPATVAPLVTASATMQMVTAVPPTILPSATVTAVQLELPAFSLVEVPADRDAAADGDGAGEE